MSYGLEIEPLQKPEKKIILKVKTKIYKYFVNASECEMEQSEECNGFTVMCFIIFVSVNTFWIRRYFPPVAKIEAKNSKISVPNFINNYLSLTGNSEN